MTSKLSAILAVQKDIKTRSGKAFTEAYHLIQKAPLFSGISRTYEPKNDEGDVYPPESTKVQIKIDSILSNATDHLARLWDVEATKDWGNTVAKGNVIVDGVTILEQVPVSYLLYLEKDLIDLATFISKLPTLDQAIDWAYDAATDSWKSNTVQSVKTKKVPKNHVKAEATDKHAAQVELYYEDILEGTWSTTKFSGAIPASRQNELLVKVQSLRDAVKIAREEANSINIEDKKVGREIIDFVLS